MMSPAYPQEQRPATTQPLRRRAAVPTLFQIQPIFLESFCHRFPNGNLEQWFEQALDSGCRGLRAEGHHCRVGTYGSEALVNARSLVCAFDYVPGETPVGIAMLDDFVRLQHADQLHLLPEGAGIALFGEHGESDIGVNPVLRVMLDVAELTADHGDRPVNGSLHFDVDHSHGL